MPTPTRRNYPQSSSGWGLGLVRLLPLTACTMDSKFDSIPCDESTTEYFVNLWVDADGDGHGDSDSATEGCPDWAGDGYVDDTSPLDDCDDNNGDVYPGATEEENGADDNCDASDDAPLATLSSDSDQMRITGETATSGLYQACIGDVDAGSPALVVLGDDMIGVFPYDAGLRENIESADERWDLPSAIYGDRALHCAEVDLDGAGATEVLVGAPESNTTALMFPEASDEYSIYEDDDDSELGTSLGIAGDLPVIGATASDGKAVVIFQEIDRGDTYEVDYLDNLVGTDSDDRPGLGTSLDGRRDLTGDGVPDLLVGGEGFITLVDGATLLEGDWDQRFTVTQAGSFGAAAISVPDMTGDGTADILASAPDEGRVYLIPGQNFGEWTVSDVARISFDGETGDGTALCALEEIGGGSAAFAIGLPGSDRVLLYAAADISDEKGTLDLDSSSASTVISGDTDTSFGAFLSAGDLNGDGVWELVVGAPGFDEGRGAVHVLPMIH